MMRGLLVAACLAALVVAGGCKKRRPRRYEPSFDAAVAEAEPMALPVLPVPAPVDAAPLADAATPVDPDPGTATLRALSPLLAVDFGVYQILGAYPELPASNDFASASVEWQLVYMASTLGEAELAAWKTQLVAVDGALVADPDDARHPAVRAYLHEVDAWWPDLASYFLYFDRKAFVDDELERARRDQPAFRAHVARLAELRGPMRAELELEWSTQLAAHPEAPRTVAAAGWLACVAVADQAMRPGSTSAGLAPVLSRCRRATEAARAVGAGAIAGQLHVTAVELGDWIAGDRLPHIGRPSEALAQLTATLLRLYPTLSISPAEAPAPRP